MTAPAATIVVVGLLAGAGCSLLLSTDECSGNGDCPPDRPVCRAELCRPLTGESPDPGPAPAPDPDPTPDPGAEGTDEEPPNEGGDEGASDFDPGEPEPEPPVDADEDGFPATDDCDDDDSEIKPGALDLCADGEDYDCSGEDDGPCGAVDLENPFQRATALELLEDLKLIGFSPNLEGLTPAVHTWSDDALVNSKAAVGVAQIGSLLVGAGIEPAEIWGSDGASNRVWRFPIVGGVLGLPDEFRLDGGRPLAPQDMVIIESANSNDVLAVGGLQGEVAWTTVVAGQGSRSLAGVDNPAHLATDGTFGQALVASVVQSRLHLLVLDDFFEPEVSTSFDLPAPPRDLAATPRRAVVLVAGDLVVVNLDSAEVRSLGLDMQALGDRVVVDVAAGRAYVAAAGGSLIVVDLGDERVVRRVDLRAGAVDPAAEVTDLVVDTGKVHVLLATEADDEGRASSYLVTVGPEL